MASAATGKRVIINIDDVYAEYVDNDDDNDDDEKDDDDGWRGWQWRMVTWHQGITTISAGPLSSTKLIIQVHYTIFIFVMTRT